jgi:hypothetical protein
VPSCRSPRWEEVLRITPASLEAFERLDYLRAPQEAQAAFTRGRSAEATNTDAAVDEYVRALDMHPQFLSALNNRGLMTMFLIVLIYLIPLSS